MKYFEHESAATFDEAVSLLKESPKGKTVVMAGGSDLIGVLKEQILEDYPEKVVDLKTVRGGEYIKQDGDTIEIGALTKLCDIVKSDLLNEKAPVLSQAARSVATPLIRNVATMGGNICQDVRCWFYRYPHGIGFLCQIINNLTFPPVFGAMPPPHQNPHSGPTDGYRPHNAFHALSQIGRASCRGRV